MPAIDARLMLTVLGPVLLLLGLARCLGSRSLVPQAKAWLLAGALFSAVAIWLWVSVP